MFHCTLIIWFGESICNIFSNRFCVTLTRILFLCLRYLTLLQRKLYVNPCILAHGYIFSTCSYFTSTRTKKNYTETKIEQDYLLLSYTSIKEPNPGNDKYINRGIQLGDVDLFWHSFEIHYVMKYFHLRFHKF